MRIPVKGAVISAFPRPAAMLAPVVFVIGVTAFAPDARGDDAPRPRLLEGAVFWLGDPLAPKKKETASVTAISFFPDGSRLVFGESNGLVSIVDIRSRHKVGVTKAHDSEIVSIVFRPGKAEYFTAARDGRIREWSFTRRDPIDIQLESGRWLTSMAISPDGHQIAIGAHNDGSAVESLFLYDANTGKRVLTIRAAAEINSVAFSRTGKELLCIAREEARIKMWNVETGKMVWSRGDDHAGPNPPVDATFLSQCAFGPGEHDYVIAFENCWSESEYCVCNLETGAIRREMLAFSDGARFTLSPDGQWLALYGRKGSIELWNPRSAGRVRTYSGHQGQLLSLAFSRDNRFFASGADDGTVIVWEVPWRPTSRSGGRNTANLRHSVDRP